MPYDYSKLNDLIIERFGSLSKFAKASGVSTRSIVLKLDGKTDWKQFEIRFYAKFLGLQVHEIAAYFFVPLVQH